MDYYFRYRFQFTILTARSTIYVLFFFWVFFFSFGESLFSLLFNFSTLTDTISSNFFFSFKYHTIFYLNTHTAYLGNTMMFYIFFFTFSAVIFLLNLRYNFNYFYISNLFFYELILICLLAYLLLKSFVILFLMLCVLLITRNIFKI